MKHIAPICVFVLRDVCTILMAWNGRKFSDTAFTIFLTSYMLFYKSKLLKSVCCLFIFTYLFAVDNEISTTYMIDFLLFQISLKGAESMANA